MAYETSYINLQGNVTDPTETGLPSNTTQHVGLGRRGELFINQLGGKYSAMAARGKVFYMSTVIAGVAIPVNAATLVSKFTLWNPSGSSTYVELIEFTMGIDSATEVVNGLALAWQAKVTSSGGAPGTLTATVNGPASTLLGIGGTSACTGYTAATLTNAAVLPVYPLGLNWDATAVGRSGNFIHNFDGKFWMPPDTLVTIVTTVAASTAAPCGLTWAEWPQPT